MSADAPNCRTAGSRSRPSINTGSALTRFVDASGACVDKSRLRSTATHAAGSRCVTATSARRRHDRTLVRELGQSHLVASRVAGLGRLRRCWPRYRGPRRDAQGAHPNLLRSHEDGGQGGKSVSVWRLAKSVRDGRSDNGIPWSARDASSIFDENRYLPGPRLRTRRGRLRKKSPRCLPPGAESLRAARRLAIWSSLTRCSTACATSRSPFAATARATAHPQLESSGSKSILSSRRGAAARLLLARREVAAPRYAATR